FHHSSPFCFYSTFNVILAASALRNQLCEWAPASHRGDQRVARRWAEGHGAQDRAGPESPTEFRAMEPVVYLRNHFDITDSRVEGLADRFRGELSTAEREQYAAAGERINKRPRVADRYYARFRTPAPVSDRPCAEPFAVNHRVSQSASRRRIRAHCQFEQSLAVALGFAQRRFGGDEAKIGSAVFDIAHSAVTIAKEEQLPQLSHPIDRPQMYFATE